MKFMKMGEFEHRFETVIPHHEDEEMKIVIEKGARDAAPKIEIQVGDDEVYPKRITIDFDELTAINDLVYRYRQASSAMKTPIPGGSGA